MAQTYDEAFERLKSNPDEVRAEIQEFHQEMKTFLQEIRDDAEKDIPETPNIPLNYMELGKADNPVDKLLTLGIAFYIQKKNRTDLLQELEQLYPKRKRLKGSYLAKVSSIVQEYVENEDFEYPGGRYSHPSYDIPGLMKFSKDAGRVNVFCIPSDIFPNINIPNLTKPFLEEEFLIDPKKFSKINASTEDTFKSIILHEYTHAYIYAGMKGRTRASLETKHGWSFNSKNLNEGAAQAVSSVYHRGQHINVDYYNESSNISRAMLQFFKACFLSYSERFDSRPEKVYKIRSRAVEAYNRLNSNSLENLASKLTGGRFKQLSIIERFSLTEAVLGEENEELRTFAVVVYYLEQAEKYSLHGLVLLNILPPDEAKSYIYELDNELEYTFDETMNELFPDEGFIEQEDEMGVLNKVGETLAEKTGSSEVRYEKTEFRDSILQIRQGIEQIENQLMGNEDLKEEEKRLLQQLVEDLREAIEAYQEENKVERTYEEEWSQEFDAEVSEIADWVKERVAVGDYTDPVRVSRNMMLQLNSIVDDYFKVTEAGENYNRKILNALKNLHGDENQALEILERHKDKQEYREMNQMLQITEKVYELVENAQQNFESALDNLEKAQGELPEN